MSFVVLPTVEVVVEDEHLSITEDETLASRVRGNFTDPIGVEQHDWKEVVASMSLTRYVTVHTGNGHSCRCELTECGVLGAITLLAEVGR